MGVAVQISRIWTPRPAVRRTVAGFPPRVPGSGRFGSAAETRRFSMRRRSSVRGRWCQCRRGPRRPRRLTSSVMADCAACAGGSMCGRAPGRGSAKPGRRSWRPLRVPSGPGRPSRRRRLTAGPARRSPRRRLGRPESSDAASCPSWPAPGGLSGPAAESPLRLRARPVPPPPPPATSATGMMSRPSFSYAVPNARRTDRLSDAFATMVSTSISRPPLAPARSSPAAGPAPAGPRARHRIWDVCGCPACRGTQRASFPRPAAGTSIGRRHCPGHTASRPPVRGQQSRQTGARHGKCAPARRKRQCRANTRSSRLGPPY